MLLLPWFHSWHVTHAFFVHNSLDHLNEGPAPKFEGRRRRRPRGTSRSGNRRPSEVLEAPARSTTPSAIQLLCILFNCTLATKWPVLAYRCWVYLSGSDGVVLLISNILLIVTMWIITIIFSWLGNEWFVERSKTVVGFSAMNECSVWDARSAS